MRRHITLATRISIVSPSATGLASSLKEEKIAEACLPEPVCRGKTGKPSTNNGNSHFFRQLSKQTNAIILLSNKA
ncbi:MAG: hypothetical protein BWY75_02370 [bacterium ADurb.Bin425]|nr:MAG: hypothetical protein BWY75_02370 [bacterium ADurb.Bin425]